MAALSALSKYHGEYPHWMEIKNQYHLKWSESDSVSVFKAIIGEKGNYPAMVKWLRDACNALPSSYSNILLYNTLTGLRTEESINSIRLVKTESQQYLKDGYLLHFQYPDVFIRRTKKAYVSLVDDRILHLAKNSGDYTYTAIHKALERKQLSTNLKYCRKIFSTYLRMNGVESELIDLLQGRIPKTVFARHYFRPDFEKSVARIRKKIVKLGASL